MIYQILTACGRMKVNESSHLVGLRDAGFAHKGWQQCADMACLLHNDISYDARVARDLLELCQI